MTTNDELINLTKSAGTKLIPFFKAVSVYFLLNAHNQNGEYWTTVLKCAPIIGLILFILLHGAHVLNKPSSYGHKVLTALVFSCFGDALLNHNYFIYGMCAFAVAQIFYIQAFGFRPLKLWIGILLYFAGAANVLLFWKNLKGALLIGLPVYTVLLVTMCWRSFALLFVDTDSGNILKILRAVGSALFVLSDTLIAMDKFYSPINNSSVWIMTTYYAAQFGMTLSILDGNKTKSNCPNKKTN